MICTLVRRVSQTFAPMIALAMLGPAQVYALDLTGTWQSPIEHPVLGPMLKCTYFGGTKMKSGDPAQGTLQITQGGADGMQLFIRMLSDSPYMIGQAVADHAKVKKGQAGAVNCDHTGSRNIGLYISKVDDVKGIMKVETRGLLGTIGGIPYPMTCKGTLIRTSATDPNVAECP